MFIVPGNHDLPQAIVDKTPDDHEVWRNASEDMPAINNLYDTQAFTDIVERKFYDYYQLEQYMSSKTLLYRNDFVSIFRLPALGVEVVTLNTAAFSTGGHKELGIDKGKLAVPEYAIIEASKKLTPGSFRVFAAHHPFEMLSDASARCLAREIQKLSDIYLFGHMHDPDSKKICGFQGEFFSNQAGAIFTQRRGAYIGYALICIDRTKKLFETRLRTYFDDRKAFDEARDITANGRFYSSTEAREFWRNIAIPIDENVFREYLAHDLIDKLRVIHDTTPNGRDSHIMFVPPPMKRTFIHEEGGVAGDTTTETAVAFDNIVSEDKNVILVAAPEYGRTTVLKEITYQLCEKAGTLAFPRIPILVDFSDIKHNVDAMLRLMKARTGDLPESVDVESLLKLGYVCVLVDDVVFSDQRRMMILRDFVSRYPKVRYIFSSPKNSAAPFGAHVVPETPIHFEFIELCVLRRREMRQLVQKFGGEADVDTVLDRLQSEFQEINLPFTAANGSILMLIYEEQSGFRPINRSVLIEQFIDTTLRKAAIDQSRRETFDYANKTALLAHVAGWMAVEDDYTPHTEAVRSEMRNYLDNLGLNVHLDQLIAEFFSARILVKRPDQRMSFRYRSVLEYFIAMQMRDKGDFKSWVMDESRYLQFINEIHYYSGKLRNDHALVGEIGQRFQKIVSEIEETDGKIDIKQLEVLQLNTKEGDASVDELAQQLSMPPLNPAERDAELEADLPRDVEDRQTVFRPRIEDLKQKLMVALFLYSGALKNMELMEDHLKRKHLAEIWKGWSIFLHISLSVVPLLAHHRRLRINGVLYEINAPHSMSDAALAKIISLKMPTAVSKILSATLGTEKLERQLVEPESGETNLALPYEFLRAALVADLRLSATPDTLRTALKRLRSSAYLFQAMIWKILDLRRLNRIETGHFDLISGDVAEAIAILKGGKKRKIADEKRHQMQLLQREGLVLRIKRQNEQEAID
jgi:hypothetical protein